MNVLFLILAFLYADIALGVVLYGVIADTKPDASVAVFGTPSGTQHLRVGGTLEGYQLVSVSDSSVTIRKADRLFTIKTGQGIDSGVDIPKITVGLEIKGNEIRATSQLRDFVAKDGLISVIMSACSEPVFDSSGRTVGYKLFEIDKGSIFDLMGLVDNDTVTHLDGIHLDSPITALRALSLVKERDTFSFRFLRNDKVEERSVVVR